MHRCTCNCHIAGPCGSTYWELCLVHFSYFWDCLPFSPPIILPPLNISTFLASKVFPFFYSSLILIHAFPFTKWPLFLSTHLVLPSCIGLLTAQFCPVWLTLIWYRQTQQVPLKVQYLSTKLHDITSKKNVIFIFTIMRTWNVKNSHYIYLEIKSRLNQGSYCYCMIQKHFGNHFRSYMYEALFHFNYNEALSLLPLYNKPRYCCVEFVFITNHVSLLADSTDCKFILTCERPLFGARCGCRRMPAVLNIT